MSNWLSVADAAFSLLDGFDGDIEQAADRLSHLDITKKELVKSLAYATLQAHAYKRRSDIAPGLFVQQVSRIVDDYREAQERRSAPSS